MTYQIRNLHIHYEWEEFLDKINFDILARMVSYTKFATKLEVTNQREWSVREDIIFLSFLKVNQGDLDSVMFAKIYALVSSLIDRTMKGA